MNVPNFSKCKRADATSGRGGKPQKTERTDKKPYEVEEFLRLYKGNFDAERFRRCRVGLYEGAKVVAIRDGMTVDSRLAAWARRWAHLSHKVLNWPAPSDSDLPWFRTEAERAYYGQATAYVGRLIAGSARPSKVTDVPIFELMPPYSEIPGLIDHVVWAYDHHTDHRLRTREKNSRAEAGSSSVVREVKADLCIGWHNVEVHALRPSDRPQLYAPVSGTFSHEYECDRILLVETPWLTVYHGKYFVRYGSYTGIMETASDEKWAELQQQLEYQMTAEYAYLATGRFIQLALYGSTYEGLEDPGPLVDNGRFRGVLVPLSPGVIEFIRHHQWDQLLRHSGFPLDKVRMAFDRMVSIDWPERGATIAGRYYRYDPVTGEVDDLPQRSVQMRDTTYRHYAASKVVFKNR